MEKRLALVIDPSGAKKGYADAKKMTKELESSAKGVTTAFDRMSKSLSNISKDMTGLQKAFSNAGLTRFEKTVKDAVGSMNALTTALNKLDRASLELLRSQERVRESTERSSSAQKENSESTAAAERAARSMAESLKFWEARSQALTSTEYDRLVQLRESVKQQDALKRSLIDTLSPAQKLQKAEAELKKQLEANQIKLKQYESGLAQKNIAAQESLSLSRKLAQSQERLNQVYSKEYKQLVENNEAIKKRIRELRGLDDAHKSAGRSASNLSQGFSALAGALGTITGGYAAMEVLRMSEEYKALQNRISVVTGSTEGLTEVTRDLLRVAQESRSSLDATADVYSKLARVNNQYGLSQAELLKITTTVSQAVSMSGATAQGAQGAMIQFAQALQNNFAAAAQEMNSIIEQTPGLADAVADAMNAVDGVTTYHMGNIKKAATEGKLEVEKVLQGLLLVSDDYAERFNLAQILVSQGWTQVTNSLTLYIGELDKATGITETLANAMMDFARNMNDHTEELNAAVLGIGTAFGVLTVALGGFLLSLVAVPAAIAAVTGGAVASIYYFRDEIVDTVQDIELWFYELLNSDLSSIASGFGDVLSNTISGFFEFLQDAGKNIYNFMVDIVKSIADAYSGSILESALKTLGLRFQLLSKAVGQTFAEMWDAVLSGFERAINWITDKVNDFAKNSQDLINVVREFLGEEAREFTPMKYVSVSADSKARVEEYKAEIEQLKVALEGQIKTTEDLITTERTYLGQQRELREASQAATVAQDKLSDSTDNSKRSFGGAEKELSDYQETLRDVIQDLRDEIATVGLSEKALAEYELITKLVTAAKKDNVAVTTEQIQEVLKLNDALFKAQEAHDAAEEAAKAQAEALEDLRDAIVDNLMDGFEAAMEGGDDFKEWFEDLLKELALTAIKNKIVIPIVSEIVGMDGVAGAVEKLTGSSGGNIFDLANNVSSLYSAYNNWVSGGNSLFTAAADMFNFGAIGSGATGSLSSGAGGSYAADLVGMNAAGGTSTGAAGGLSSAVGAGIVAAIPMIGSLISKYFGQEDPRVSLGGFSQESFQQTLDDFNTNIANLQNSQDEGASSAQRRAATERDTLMSNYVETAFGGLGVTGTSHGGGDANFKPILEAVAEIDSQIASYLTEGEIAKVTDAMSKWTFNAWGKTSTKVTDIQDQLSVRLQDQLEVIDQELGNFVKEIANSVDYESAAEDFNSRVGFTEFVLAIRDTLDVASLGVESFREMQREGENLIQTVTRTVAQMEYIQSVTEQMGLNFEALGEGAVLAADNIVKAAGGLDAFNASVASYYENFYSEEEKFQMFAEDLQRTFDDLNVELPTTTEGFRDLVESLDLTKESDQELYAQLLALNPQVRQFIDGLGGVGDAISSIDLTGAFKEKADNALEGVLDSISAERDRLTESYNSQRDALNSAMVDAQAAYQKRLDAIDAEIAALDSLKQFAQSLRDFANGLMLDNRDTVKASRIAAQSFLIQSLEAYKASGQLPTEEALAPHLEAIRQPSEDLFSSFTDYARDFYTTKNNILQLADYADESYSIEEQSLRLQKDQIKLDTSNYRDQAARLDQWYKDSMEKLDAQEEEAQSLYEAVYGVDTSLDTGFASVVAAIQALHSALADAVKLQDMSGGTFGTLPNGDASVTFEDDALTKAYQDLLGRDPDVAGYKWYTEQIASGNKTLEQVISEIAASEEAMNPSIRGFATGGVHSGGWRIVGENGPEMEYTPPSRIYSNADSASLVDVEAIVRAIAELREDVRQANLAIARNTQKTAKILDRWDYDGQPEVRDYNV